MIIKYGDATLDTDTIVTVQDAMNYAENIKGQKTSDFAKSKQKPVQDTEILFDQLTDKETALRNLDYSLDNEYSKIKAKLFPASVGNLILVAKQMGQKDMVSVPPVDPELYADLQKVAYLKQFFHNYSMFLIQSRVGFGLTLSLGNNGQIYCLKDLRELHSKAV